MALKRVASARGHNTSESNGNILGLKSPGDIGKSKSIVNRFNTLSGGNQTDDPPIPLTNTTIQKSPVMNSVRSFENNTVSMQRIARINKGIYEFRIDDINVRENVQTQYGLKSQYVITFSLYSEITKQVQRLSLPYNISSNPQSSLMLFLGAFKEIFKGQRITIRHLVGLIGQSRIHHFVSEAGNIFEKIEILSVENPDE